MPIIPLIRLVVWSPTAGTHPPCNGMFGPDSMNERWLHLYGTWGLFSTRAVITLPSVSRDWLMFPASRARLSTAPERPMFSLPARSTWRGGRFTQFYWKSRLQGMSYGTWHRYVHWALFKYVKWRLVYWFKVKVGNLSEGLLPDSVCRSSPAPLRPEWSPSCGWWPRTRSGSDYTHTRTQEGKQQQQQR